MIHDSNGVPTYADANDAKEKLSPRIKDARFAFSVMPDWKQRNTIADLTNDAETKAAAAVGRKSPHCGRSNEIEASILSMVTRKLLPSTRLTTRIGSNLELSLK